MKRLYSILALLILFGTSIPEARAASLRFSVDFFHDNLDSFGDWREVGDYGYCWQPRDVDPNWRPYSDGRWLYTDSGWTWDSDEPYAWAVYHYGRWARVDQIGWVWVPGTEWGPAWVSWRRSPGYVGWAPLPPEAEFNRDAGFNGRVDADYDIGPTNYSFVEVRNFGSPRLRTVIVEPRENITIIQQTTNITQITYVNNVIFNGGPQYDTISRESAQPIRRMKLERREDINGDSGPVNAGQLKASVEGNSLRVVAIPFNTTPATAPRKVAAKVEKVQVDHGWKNAGPPADVAKLRTQIKSNPATPAEVMPKPNEEKNAVAPAQSPTASPVPVEQPVRGKIRDSGQPTSSATPITTEAKPAPTAKPGKPAKVAMPVKPDVGNPQASPSVSQDSSPSSQSKKGRARGSETPGVPADVAPKAQVEKPKTENVESKRTQPPIVGAPERQRIHPGAGEATKSEQPADRKTQNTPEPRPQVKMPEQKQQTAPSAAKESVKGKDHKKDSANPEATPQ
jgi:hypothetical protein